jgi:predicted nucleic acid-binding protein
LTIDWHGIVELQVTCLRNGINKVGVPDLIIAQQAMQHRISLLTLDKHFRHLGKLVPLAIHS